MPALTAPTCILADDHSVVRDGLRARLESDGWVNIVGEADSGANTIDLIRRLRPQLAIVDIRMPDGDGIEVTRMVRDEALPTRVILYTVLTDPRLLARAFHYGAAGYVGKEAPPEVVLQAVREVHAGHRFIDPAITDVPAQDDSCGLTMREVEILARLALGHSNTVIARDVFLTAETVKSHVSSILSKLGADSRTEAVAVAIRRGIID